ncbi:hypothetical protein BN12_3770001 [Nostocoides japonicum T1-X7]|uniref:Uncharacterized protein n=1 Tax=Nostocoides japonicum T1-X7 TaxID=1194083 RepID=A0A077LZ43_9MICO|nr:hypothetical protein [Tetrasphaera japonica]CCH78916.1 hypothetical protein BN12_3770001 [Tetrasphaera japonica T1-X7]
MDELTMQLRNRVAEARRQLDEARLSGDDYLVDIQLAVLQELARVARENGVELPEGDTDGSVRAQTSAA